MTESGRTCVTCSAELPETALFCPSCGASTPTEVSGPSAATTLATSAEELDYRARLQRALGQGYELRELIGRGGFADVYAAFELSLKREIAVKAVRPDLVVQRTMMERFRREAEAAAQLRHPNILPIYTVGEGEGLVWFTMPRVKGESLRVLLEREGALSPEEARRILREVASALETAHEAGLIHRDIKPDNIMLEGRQRRALVMDFGIAKAMATGGDLEGLTAEGVVIGTPQYMSPEQATADPATDHRTDIYSLGVVAYQMLSGRLPFQASSAHEAIAMHLTATPPPLTGVPEYLASVVMRCLAKRPADRWQSAADLVREADCCAPYTQAPPRRDRKPLWIAAASLATVTALVMLLKPLASPHSAAAASVAVLPFDNLSRDSNDLYLAEGLADEMTARLAAIERLQVKSLSAVRRAAAAAAGDLAALGRELGVRYLVEGSVRRSGTRVKITVSLVTAHDGFRAWAEEFDATPTDLLDLQERIAGQVASTIAGRLLPAERASLAARPTSDAIAYDHFLRGNFYLGRRSPRAMERAIAEYAEAVRRDPRFTAALAHIALAYGIAVWWGWRPHGLSFDDQLERGLAACDSILARDSSVADAWAARGYLLSLRNPRTYEGVEESFRRSFALDSGNAEVWQQYAWVRSTLGDDTGAERAYRKALALEPERAVTYSAMAWHVAFLTGRTRQALALADSALQLDPDAYYVLPWRAEVYLELGDTARARAAAELAVRASPPEFRLVALGALAAVDAATGARRTALARVDTMTALVITRGEPTFLEANQIASVLVRLGEHRRAIEVLEQGRPRGAPLWFMMRFPVFDPIRQDPRFERLFAAARPQPAPI